VPNSSSWHERLCFNDNAHTVVVSWYEPGARRLAIGASSGTRCCFWLALQRLRTRVHYRARSARANARNPRSSKTHKVAVRIIRVPSNEDRTRFKQTRTLFDFVRAPFDSSRTPCSELSRRLLGMVCVSLSLSLRNALHREPWHDLTLKRASDTASPPEWSQTTSGR
jgi:hypothetical protein